MKRILIALMVATAFCTTLLAQKHTTIYKDSAGSSKITVTKTSSPKLSDQKNAPPQIADSSAMVESEELASDTLINDSSNSVTIGIDSDDFPFDKNDFGNIVGSGVIISIVAIIFIFGLPIFIIFIVFFFRYKNRKARYRLAEQAIAAGQPLPENFIKEKKGYDPRHQGINNTFTGIGLFIFLWAITGSIGIGSIGLLVMFIGLGQWLIGATSKKENKDNQENKEKQENKDNSEK